jgi:hypothetical protein
LNGIRNLVKERIFRLPEFDSEVKKILDNKGLHITVPDRN